MVKLGITTHEEHKDVASSVEWSPNYDLFTSADDMIILKRDIDGQVVSKTTIDSCVTSIAWMPSVGLTQSDQVAVSCCDGTFRLMSSGGREEKKVNAHHGATIKVAWNFEGSALYSAGEDGAFKVWSKAGNLRNTPITKPSPLYSFAVGPGGEQVCYTCEKKLFVESVGEKMKPATWLAHDATVLSVDWNIVNNLVVSGGEDCLYKVWDNYGVQLYQSQPYVHAITSVSWAPNGTYFAVGAFDLLRLCDKTGWSRCREQPKCGSILNIAWTPDGTQLAGASGSGTIVVAKLVDRVFEWDQFEVTLKDPRMIVVRDTTNDTYENLEFNRSRVVDVALGYGHLIVSTSAQCYIYSTSNWNTPYIFDSNSTVSLILLCAKSFLVVSPGNIVLYAYDGRKISQPKFAGLRTEFLSSSSISLSPDIVAIIDSSNKKMIRTFDTATGRPCAVPNIEHKAEVVFVALNQTMAPSSVRQLVVVDTYRELHLYRVNNDKNYGHKLRTHVDTVAWHDTSEILVAVADGRLVTWAYPQVMWIDRDLVESTVATKDVAESIGKLSTIVSVHNTKVIVRRADGPLVTATVSPYPAMLFDFASNKRWDESLRLCRFVEDDSSWAMLAAMAVNENNLEVAEFAYAALKLIDKLEYVLYIKELPSEDSKKAELALFKRRPDDAEQIFLQANPPLLYRAIKMNIRLFRWERALELAVKYRSHVDTVLAYRSQYLEDWKKEETDDRFKQLASSVKWEWEQVRAKKNLEKQEEYTRNSKPLPKKKEGDDRYWG